MERTDSNFERAHAALKEMRRHIVREQVVSFADFQLWCDRQNATWSRILDAGYAEDIERFINSAKEDQPEIPRLAEQPRLAEEAEYLKQAKKRFGGFHE